MTSRVSPRAGGTRSLDGDEVVLSMSDLSDGTNSGLALGVPSRGDGEYPRVFELFNRGV